jgi:hypothetical protein
MMHAMFTYGRQHFGGGSFTEGASDEVMVTRLETALFEIFSRSTDSAENELCSGSGGKHKAYLVN